MKFAALAMAIGLTACTSTPHQPWADVSDDELLRRIFRPKPVYPECLEPIDCQLYLAPVPGEPYNTMVRMLKEHACYEKLCSRRQEEWRWLRQPAIDEYNRRNPDNIIVPVEE